MRAVTRPRTDAELRALGMPQSVIDYRNGDFRAMTVPLHGVVVEQAVPPSAEVTAETLGRKIREARHRFVPREG